MLNPEYAKEQLQAVRIPDWKATKAANVATLPAGLREIVFAILGCDSSGQPYSPYYTWHETQNRAVGHLDILSIEERLKIFELLFPQIYLHVEAAWQLLSRLPYQLDWQRKAFRAPHSPDIIKPARCELIKQLLYSIQGYDQDITWLAAWTPYLSYANDALGTLFAAAIDSGSKEGEKVFNILIDSARGEHEIGAMGRHVIRALLIANSPDGWTFVENLLLAAQRQEGLRQTILETIYEAHPDAFGRMLHLLLEHDLTRFSATIWAVDDWFDFGWDVVNIREINKILEQMLLFLESPAEQTAALESSDAQTVYLALWSIAFDDAIASIAPAIKLIQDPIVERRFVAAHFLTQLGIPEAQIALLPALEDKDLRVAAIALNNLKNSNIQEIDLFERLSTLR